MAGDVLAAPAFPRIYLPAPQLSPYFGLTSNEREIQSYLPSLAQQPTSFGGLRGGHATVESFVDTLRRLTGGAVDSDPRRWTPEQAGAQTDRALARIGQVNPELARQLAEQRTGQPTDSGGGFLKGLLSAVHTVFSLPVVKQVFAVIDRAGRVVPEILADDEDQSVWGNVAQALAGHSNKGMGQVLDKWHVLTGDSFFERLVHNTLAFAGDMAVNPFSYVCLNACGVERALVAKTFARAVGETGVSSAALAPTFERLAQAASIKAVRAGGRAVTKEEVWEKTLQALFRGGFKTEPLTGATLDDLVLAGLKDIHPDAVGGLFSEIIHGADTEAMLNHFNLVNDAFRLASTQGVKGAARKLGEQLGIDYRAVEEVLSSTVKEGRGWGVSRAAYKRGKAAAASMGAPFFRVNLAPFKFRWVSNRVIPFTFPAADFGFARRFMAGLSGQVRLSRMVAAGEATVDHMRAWWEGGAESGAGALSGLRKYDRAVGTSVADRLAGGSFLHLGSAFYPLSEAVGNLTAHFSHHAAVLRGGGLAALVEADTARQARLVRESIADSVKEVKDASGNPVPRDIVERQLTEVFGLHGGRTRAEVEEAGKHLTEYLRLVPTSEARALGAAKWFDQRIEATTLAARAAGKEVDEATLSLLRQQKVRAVEAEFALNMAHPKGLDTVEYFAQIFENAHKTLLDTGVDDVFGIDDIDRATTLHPDDLALWQETGGEATRGRLYRLRSRVRVNPEKGTATVFNIENESGNIVERGAGGRWVPRRRWLARGYQVEQSRGVRDAADASIPAESARPRFRPTHRDVPRDPAYYYREDSSGRLAAVKEEGLTPSGRGQYISGGGAEDRLFFHVGGTDVPNMFNLGEDNILFRVLKTDIPDVVEGDLENEVYTLGTVQASRIEYLADDGHWRKVVGEAVEPGKGVAAKTRSPEFGIRLINPATESTAREVEEQVRAAFELAAAPPFTEADDVSKASDFIARLVDDEATLNDQVAQAVTLRLKEMTYDGIVSDDGLAATVFHQEDRLNIKRVLDDASRTSRGSRVAPVLSKDVTDAVFGLYGGGARKARTTLYVLERKLAGKSVEEADTEIRRSLAELGVTLKPGQSALELDPVKMVARRAEQVAQRVGDRHMGRANRLVDAAGWSHSVFAGDAVGLQRWEYVVGPSGDVFSDSISSQAVSLLAERAAALQKQLLDEEEEMSELSQRVATLRERAADPEEFLVSLDKNDLKAVAGYEDRRAAYEASTIEYKNTLDEVNRMRTRLEVGEAKPLAALVPAEDALNQTGLEVIDWIPGFEDLAMPKYMAQEMWWASRGFKNLDGFHRKWRQFMSLWKAMATYLVPGFHVRNAEGAWFNNLMGGVAFEDDVMAFRIGRAANEPTGKWAARKVAQHDPGFLRDTGWRYLDGKKAEDLTYLDLAAHFADVPGLQSTHSRTFGEWRVGTENLEAAVSRETRPILRPLQVYSKASRRAGTMVENHFRASAMVRGLRDTGGDWSAARSFTMMRQGDYADLSDWEYGWVRDLIPFYKWMRTNTPFQMHLLLENPAALLAVTQAKRALWGVQGKDYDVEKYRLPTWMQESFSVPFGKDEAYNIVMFDLPMNDLFIGGREFVSSFLPTVRPLLENYVTGQETFTGRPLTGRPVALSNFLLPLQPFLQAVGLVSRGPTGQAFVSDRTANLLNMVPVFSRFRNWVYADPDRTKLRMNNLASAAFGLSVRPVDEDTMTNAELDFYYTKVLPELERLRGMGYELPTTRDLKSTIGDTDTVLAGLGISPSALSSPAAA